MIPIQKNIIVVDEQGNIYEATYPKRAKGLVKNGRARFISENTICLACPPGILEKHMSDLDLLIKKEIAQEAGDSVKAEDVQNNKDFAAETADSETVRGFQSNKFSMDYVLEQIEKIASQTEHLGQVIGAVGGLERSENLDASQLMGLEAKINALRDVVKCRETTNQQLLRFYEKMYDNIIEEERFRKNILENSNK